MIRCNGRSTDHKRTAGCPCNRAFCEARQARLPYNLCVISGFPMLCNEADRHRTLQLRREYEQALQDAEPVNAQFTGDLESYAKTQCLKITEMMCNKLPVELRDLIYRYICIEDQPIPVGPYFHFRPYNRKVAPDRLASALSDGRVQIDHSERPDPTILMPDSHIFNIEYVGWTAMVEMKLAYLANNTFSICNIDQGIATFLDWNTSEEFVVTPRSTRSGPGPGFETAMSVTNSKADEFVRRLQIRVKCEHYDNQHPRYTSQNCCDFFDTECDHLRSSRISLEPLTYLDPRDRPLELEFIIMTALRSDPTATEDQQRYFINLLQALRNTFYTLIYDRGNTMIKIVHHDDNISAFPRDITALWSLTKEQWEHVRNDFVYFSAIRRHHFSCCIPLDHCPLR
jgi:hypothetical protein